jgi:hypothetical protein
MAIEEEVSSVTLGQRYAVSNLEGAPVDKMSSYLYCDFSP